MMARHTKFVRVSALASYASNLILNLTISRRLLIFFDNIKVRWGLYLW